MRPMRYEDGTLQLLDQTRLPVETAWVACSDVEAVASAIRNMIVRGAPAIGVTAAYGMAIAALCGKDDNPESFILRMSDAAAMLAGTRPTAVNLFWALERMNRMLPWHGAGQDAIPAFSPSDMAEQLLKEAQCMEEEDISVNRSIGAHGNALVPEGARILTHCNAGALATADYGTALGVIRAAHDAGKRIHVYSDETRPYLQGARLTAWELMQDGIPVTLQCDSMAGWLMASGRIDLVITGADRIAANGDTANKIGTYSLAVLAKYHRIPFYIAAPVSTIDRKLEDGSGIPIEQRPAKELTEFRGIRIAPEGVNVYNPGFDVTPGALISAIITERGILRHPYVQGIAGLFES
jgi:methylthioribose-1-phosphate isomerase